MKETEYYKSGQHTMNARTSMLLNNTIKISCVYCSIEITRSNVNIHQNSCHSNPLNQHSCKFCSNTIHISKIFCDKSCAAKFNNKGRIRTEVSKQKTSNSMKGIKKGPGSRGGGRKFSKVYFIECKICEKLFTSRKLRITCGDEFCVLYASTNPTYDKKIFNPFQNKMINLDSPWEYEMAEFMIANNIEWIRPKGIPYVLDGKDHKYYPDFYLPKYNIYLDPKNPFLQEIQKDKLNIVIHLIPLKFGIIKEMMDYLHSLI